MRHFRDHSIRQKLTILIAAASVAGLALAGAAVALYDATTFRPRAVQDATTLAAILRANAIPTLQFDDPAAARENLATLRNRPEIAAAVISRPDGSTFADYRRLGTPAPPAVAPPAHPGVAVASDALVVTDALESDGQPLGWLRLEYDLPSIWERLPQYAILATVVLLAIGTTALLLLGALGRSVVGPLRSVADTVGRLTATRDLGLRLAPQADDEIGALTRSFNRMLDTLQERDTALQAGAAALRESEARLRLALSVASMETWAVPLAAAGDGDLARGSRASLARLLADVHPDDRVAAEGAITEAAADHRGFEIEFRTIRGGEERIMALRGQAVGERGGTEAQLLGVAQDVTERRRLEGQLLQAQKMEAIGNLAGGIAHDFNNLLTGMLGYLSFVQRRLAPDSPVRVDIEEVERAARRAASLTSQLLSYARRQIVIPSLVDLNHSVQLLDLLLGRLLGEGIAVETALAPSVWPVRIDPGQLEQVIVNLAINARDAMPDGGTLTIATRNVSLAETDRAARALEPGEFVELAVSDTGTGIPPDVLGRIFEPFFTTKPQGQGTGLGLAVCYGIVKQAGGDLTVESHLGRGSMFRVLLPRVAGAAIRPSPVAEEELVGGSETILLVEDDAAVRELAARTLREVGYQVLEADDGPVASVVAGKHGGEIGLLLTDVVMPTQGGGALALELRRSRPSLPVLYMSGYPDDAVVRQGVHEAEAPFLAKPFTPGELRRAARRAIDAAAQTRAHPD